MATADTRDYVLAVESNKTEAAQIAKSTAEKLENKQVSLIEVVQALGEYINDEDEKIRARAVSYLTAVVSALSPKFLSRQQIQVLCGFLCERIEDGGAIEGIQRLQSLDRFTNEMAQTVLRALVTHFDDLRSRPQSTRYKVLTLLNDLLNNHRKAVRDLKDESLTGVVGLVAGEKDPRNLMLVFSMLRVVMVEWDISNHAESLFDAVYAYFPITFRPPPNDPYGITAQDLKDRLRDCLAATGTLAPQVIPNMLDRLDSTSETVKKDVLSTLAACALNYDTSVVSQYAITLWDAVKFEILQAQEPFLADEALLVLKNIAACLSTSTNHSPTAAPLVQYLKPINKECLEHLQEPASRQASASGDIIRAVASATVYSFETVAKTIGPALFTIHQSAESILSQRAILEITNKLFDAAIEVYGSWNTPSSKNFDGRESLLVELRDKLVGLYSRALMGTVKEEVSFRLTAAKGLLLLAQMRSFLENDEIGLFVQYFGEIVIEEESYGRDELKRNAMTALASISSFKPRLITDITFPAFMARLPNDEKEAQEMKDYHSVLEGLAEISVGRELLETLMRRLLNKLDILLSSDPLPEYPYTGAVLSTIYYVLERSTKNENASLDSYYPRVVIGLVQRSTTATSGPLADEKILDFLGRNVNLIARHSDSMRLQSTAENVYRMFRENPSQNQDNGSLVAFDPPYTAILSTWLLAALPRDANIGVVREHLVPQVVVELKTLASPTEQISSAVRYSCLRQMSLLVNKHLPISHVGFVNTILSSSYTELASSSHGAIPDFLLRLIFTLSKALVLRLTPQTNQILDDLLSLLDSTKYPAAVSKLAAPGFSAILASDDVLSKTNYAQIRLLAPQRVFQTVIPLISSRFKASHSPDEKQNYLVAMSGILGELPSEIVMPELPTLLPLLLQSLDLADSSVNIATLDTLAVVITNNPSALVDSGHLPALVRRLLTTASLPKQPKQNTTKSTIPNTTTTSSLPHVRHLATKCVTLLPKHVVAGTSGINPLLALKKEVLQRLMVVLDDPKRDVRKQAVDARAAWLRGVDDVDDDDDDDD